jgi:hypothetical protein
VACNHLIDPHILVLRSLHSSIEVLGLSGSLEVQTHLDIIETLSYVIVRILAFQFQIRINAQTAKVAVRCVFTIGSGRRSPHVIFLVFYSSLRQSKCPLESLID